MHVEVTQDHIDRANNITGRFSKARSCPVALAICDQLHLNIGQVVAYYHISFLDRNGNPRPFTASTPEPILQWMERYDAGQFVRPIEFDVKLEATY